MLKDMAIRPVDLQAAINQSTQMAGVQRQAEIGSETSRGAFARQFAAKLTERDETVGEALPTRDNRVEEDEPNSHPTWSKRRQRRRPRPNVERLGKDLRVEIETGDDHLIDVMV